MEGPVLHSTVPLALEIVANGQDGMRVEFQKIGEAVRFISIGSAANAAVTEKGCGRTCVYRKLHPY